jgi:pyridoxal phosphate enzyme (YggS family)
MATAAERLALVNEQIKLAALERERDPAKIRLVAVGKTFPAEVLAEFYRAGQRDFGENRVQEALEKSAALPPTIRWHLIGHLQTNKVAVALETFSLIHSVDSFKLARRLERLAGGRGRPCRALVQVDLAGEESKYGLPPQELPELLEEALSYRHLQICGLMVLPPYFEDPEESRPFYRRLRELAHHAKERGLLGNHGPVELSMGMSHDYRVAVEEGATLLRVGTALFGPRQPAGAPAEND